MASSSEVQPPQASGASPLILRVMHLCLPKMSASCWSPIDDMVRHGLASTSVDDKQDMTISLDQEKYPTDEMALQLPTQQGRVFVGEAFRAYISVGNSLTNAAVNDLKLRVSAGSVSLTTGSQSWMLHDQEAVPQLPPQEHHDVCVCHCITTPGVHTHTSIHTPLVDYEALSCCKAKTLVELDVFHDVDAQWQLTCEITYVVPEQRTDAAAYAEQSETAETLTLKRSYRFPALEPFYVTYRTVQLYNENILIECRCTNITDLTVYLSSVTVKDIPSLFRLKENSLFPTVCLPAAAASQGIATMRVNDTFSFLVTLSRPFSEDNAMKPVLCLGSLQLEWRLPTGGSGTTFVRLKPKNPALTHPPKVALLVRHCPSCVPVETLFTVTYECRNYTKDALSPIVTFPVSPTDALVLQGELERSLEVLPPGRSAAFEVSYVAVFPGFHALQNICCSDAATGNNLCSTGTLASVVVV